MRALPETVAQQPPPPELKVRLMEEVRADVEAEKKHARAAKRRERAASRQGFRDWLAGISLGGLTWKPLAGMAAVILIVAAGVGYAVGNGGGTEHRTPSSRSSRAGSKRQGRHAKATRANCG